MAGASTAKYGPDRRSCFFAPRSRSRHSYHETRIPMALIVFTHGLGASEGFWGSTIDVVRSHERFMGHEIQTWGYRTNRQPEPLILKRPIQTIRGWKHQSLPEVGEELWSNLRSWSDKHDEIVLVGHSMGGLVSAAALVHGFMSGEDRDVSLCAKLRGLICIATPFAGASSAEMLAQLYRRFGKNKHIADLRPKSATRKQVLHDFARVVLNQGQLTFNLMRAADDVVVLSGEITSPFSRDQYLLDVLSGGHSECISNLNAEHVNLHKLITAIEGTLNSAPIVSSEPEIALFTGRSVTIRNEYDDRLSRMKDRLDILAWGLASFREDYGNRLVDWATNGTRIRLLLVNPNSIRGSTLCELQDELEGRNRGSTANDIATFLTELESSHGGIEVRVSDFHPGTNVFRIDGDMFFGPYIAGTVSRNAPTGVVSDDHWLFDVLLSHFECLWNKGTVFTSLSDLPSS